MASISELVWDKVRREACGSDTSYVLALCHAAHAYQQYGQAHLPIGSTPTDLQ